MGLRVYLPASPTSQVLQYSAIAIAEGFQRIAEKTEVELIRNKQAIKEGIERIKPDLVVLQLSTRQECGVIPDEIPVISWIQDWSPYLMNEKNAQHQKDNDFLFGMWPHMCKTLREKGWRNVYCLPQVARDVYIEQGEKENEKLYDIGFPCMIDVAHSNGDYERFISRTLPIYWAIQEGYNVALWGEGWTRFPIFAKYWRGYARPGKALAEAYASCRAILHVNTDTNMHQRVFEAMACGSTMLIQKNEHDGDEGDLNSWFTKDVHYLGFEKGSKFDFLLRLSNSKDSEYSNEKRKFLQDNQLSAIKDLFTAEERAIQMHDIIQNPEKYKKMQDDLDKKRKDNE